MSHRDATFRLWRRAPPPVVSTWKSAWTLSDRLVRIGRGIASGHELTLTLIVALVTLMGPLEQLAEAQPRPGEVERTPAAEAEGDSPDAEEPDAKPS